MQTTAASVSALIEAFSKLPGIGPKTAQRLTYFLLRGNDEHIQNLADALLRVRERVRSCTICFNMTETEPCAICAAPDRDQDAICVVEEPLDILALERTHEFKGLYHVLHGAISPLEGIGPENLRISELVNRVRASNGAIKEIILATNPNLEGDVTAMYIQKLLTPLNVRLTRLARGLPIGGDLEYADEVTLSRALEGRREM